ncbi:sickle tail protein isoform 2-T2 [Polymixia lowei]
MPNEITGQDTLRALFVSAFPHQLTMKMLESPNVAVYIKDTSRNVYYDLEDVRNISSHSCLKVYLKDPAQVFNRHARPSNTDGRISKEMLYGSHSPVHTAPSSSRSTLHSLQGSMSPPTARSMPSSPSRMVYGGAARGPGSATLPRERLSGVGRPVAVCPSSSAILERRDVKPDEALGSSKSLALVVRGGPQYPDSYCCSLQDGGGGRLSLASSQGSAPPSLTADVVDTGGGGGLGGLQQYRASVKSLGAYGESLEHQTQSLHRQKSKKYSDSQLPLLGTKTPPPSPQRVSDVRMIDGQIIGGVGLVTTERMSPVRRSLRRESNGAVVEIVNRSRGSGSSSSSSSVFVDSPHGHPDRLFQGHLTATDPQSERIKAMEQQIASLAGLVQHALAVGPNVTGVKDNVSESDGRSILSNRPGASPVPAAQNPAPLIDGYSSAPLAIQAPPLDRGLQQSLTMAKKSVSELRLQLSEIRQLQLAHQESVGSMLRMAGQELLVLVCDRRVHSEQAGHRRRVEMEEERIRYLTMQERVQVQLSELEDYVDHLRRDSASSSGQLSVTLRDVEEGAVNLRRVGEALATLKGEFPELQMKMRAVLRVEVEAVRFLKEEPHKMDAMLKRVKALTEVLGALRRCVTENPPHLPESSTPARSAPVESVDDLEAELTPQSSPKPQPRSLVRAALPNPPASPVLAHHVKSSPATVLQSSHHHPSPPLTPTHGRDLPTVAKVSPRSRESSPALQKRTVPVQAEAHDTSSVGPEPAAGQPAPASTQESYASRAAGGTDTEATERETPEGSQSETTPETTQSDPRPTPDTSQHNQSAVAPASGQPAPTTNTTTDFEQILEEAQASLMRSIPDLEVSDSSAAAPEQAALTRRQEAPLDPTPQAPVEDQAQSQQLPLEPAALADHEEDDPKLPDEVDNPHPKTSLPAPLEASQAPPAAPGPERSSRPLVEKPRRPSVEKERRQSPDKAGKSPPPPPPRRFYPAGPGLTTGRSGEVIFTSRKDPVGAQDEDEKEAAVAPQPKPPRQPPEVKPKPQNPQPVSSTTSGPQPVSSTTSGPQPVSSTTSGPQPAPVSSTTSDPVTVPADVEEDDDDEEEEEDNFMKELQVFQKCTVREVGTRSVVDLSASDPQSREIDPKILLWRNNPLFITDGNSSNVPPSSPRVMYYVTAQLSDENPLPGENAPCHGEDRVSPTSQTSAGSSPTAGQLSKSRHASSSGSPEKAAKGQKSLQDTQRQFRQPRLVAIPR